MADETNTPNPSLPHSLESDKKEKAPVTDKWESGTSFEEDGQTSNYLTGIRLHLITAALLMMLFLTNLEIPIVTTSLVGITDDLGGFQRSSWVISSYLLGYVGVLVIFAKLSDIFGRKLFVLLSVAIFVIFSAACGGSQNLTELIIFRAFQGVGAGGCYALCSSIMLELVPDAKYASYMTLITIVFSISLLTGPIMGGAINDSSTWRWVFLLNLPAAVPAGIVLFLCIPRGFPHHGRPSPQVRTNAGFLSKDRIGRVDFVGAALLLLGTLALVAALEDAGTNFPWKSAFVITLLTVGGLLWIAFLLWERRVGSSASSQEPVLPWRFIKSRGGLGLLLNAVFLGACWFPAIFQLPQKLQIVNKTTPLNAGIRLMPLTFAAPIGSTITAVIAKKGVPPIYMVLFASALQIVGFALLSTLPANESIRGAQYGYEVIAGFGCGINISLLVLMTPFSVVPQDKAVAVNAVGQFRLMGGAIGLAIVSTAMSNYVKSRLGHFLDPHDISLISQSAEALATFPPETQNMVRHVLAEGYNLQMKILAGLAGGQILSTLLMWRKEQIKV